MILVTGATGFVGRSLMQRLNAEERPVKSFLGRMENISELRAELEGVDTVIHLAGAESRDRVRLLRRVDIEGTAKLIVASRASNVKRIIYLSRLNAEPRSHFALLQAKGKAERLLIDSGIPTIIVRSATLFGRDDHFLNVIAALAAWTWPVMWLPGRGRVAMQPLWVEDLVRCLVLCLDRQDLINKRIELAGEERVRYEQLTREVLYTAGMRRWSLGLSLLLIRPISFLFFSWWRYPPVTRFFLDRFTVPEVAPIDSVLRHFYFRPTRMSQQSGYLRRKDHLLRLFQLP